MSDLAVPAARIHWAWLCNPRFDLSFIVGIPALACLTGLIVIAQPHLFTPILIFDLWFLGYHHVVSTYTRLCFDRKSLSEHWPLLAGLLPVVALVTLAAAYALGLWIIVSVYFYWQWFHYTRQSWGISRAYRGKERGALYEDGWLDQATFYALPILVSFIHPTRTRGSSSAWNCRFFRSLPVGDRRSPGHLRPAWAIGQSGASRLGARAGSRRAYTLDMLTHFSSSPPAISLIVGHHPWLAGDQDLAQCAVHPLRFDVQKPLILRPGSSP